MNDAVTETQMDWAQANQRHLVLALGRVRERLKAYATEGAVDPASALASDAPRATDAGEAVQPYALDTLCALFGLSEFERDVLLMCAGMELEGAFPALIARTHGDGARDRPDFGLALAAFPNAHWSALSPGAPLRRWRLIELGAGSSLVTSPLRIDERVLHFLSGVQHLDEHLRGFVQPVVVGETVGLVPSHAALAEQIAAAWSQTSGSKLLPAVQLCGQETAAKRAVAAAAVGRLGLNLYEMSTHVLPLAAQDLEVLIRLWEREAALSNSALLLDGDDADRADAVRQDLIRRFVENVGGVLLIAGRERQQVQHRPLINHDVAKPTSREQQLLWEESLGPAAARFNGQVTRLVSQFDLDRSAIQAVCSRAAGESTKETLEKNGEAQLGSLLWEACRVQARPRLEDLAQRIEPVATWEDLVLPEPQLRTLQDIAIHVRQRAKVYDAWGFAAKSSRGLGISALFAGPSGTGKTMSAEVLANALHLDLHRIDLSQVVSKYIGETEKNLRRVFDAAEEGGAILLFDEADALFGKRSEVKDSHDRYANIEVSYLLQRMEAYRGLAILTTNRKSALDDAFMRRLRFAVQFPFPDRAQRAAIWQRIYPPETPVEGLDWSRLAQLTVAGGNIRNIALNAAFLAAEADMPVGMEHIHAAAREEYAKLERPLTELRAGREEA